MFNNIKMNTSYNDLFLNCIKISNAYRNKHRELQEVFKAYKNLSDTCDDTLINQKLAELSQSFQDNPVISKKKLKSKIEEQNKIISELGKIQKEVSIMYPDL